MKAFSTPPTFGRATVLQQLSRIRYPEQRRQISDATMWRWCKVASIQTGLREFTQSQCQTLAQVALWRRQGYSTGQIKLFFGEPTRDHSKRIRNGQPRQGSSSASNFDFDSFFGGASGG
jgi:hypothetical protein